MREKGTVKKYLNARGFGFIQRDGAELFFHVKDVTSSEGGAAIQPGAAVEFTVIAGSKGLRAVDVAVIE